MRFAAANRSIRRTLIRIFSGRIALLVYGAVIITAIGLPLSRNIAERRQVGGERTSLESEIARLEGKNAQLRGLLHYLSSDQFAEAQARYNLNFRKPGESVVVIKDPDGTVATGSAAYSRLFNSPAAPRPEKAPPNPVRWWRYFFE